MEWVKSTWINSPFGGKPTMRGSLRLLVAFGERHILWMIELNLQRAGCQVLTANSGQEVLEKAQAEMPDRILLYATLPDISGFAVIERLKENPDTATIPIMLVITEEQEAAMRQGLLPQVDHTPTRPFDHKKLSEFLGIYPQ